MDKNTATMGVMSLIAGAKANNDTVKFTLDGDLHQMFQQENFLQERGFKTGRLNVYVGLYTEEDYKKALAAIWEFKCPGWWHYREQYVKYGICPASEFQDTVTKEAFEV